MIDKFSHGFINRVYDSYSEATTVEIIDNMKSLGFKYVSTVPSLFTKHGLTPNTSLIIFCKY